MTHSRARAGAAESSAGQVLVLDDDQAVASEAARRLVAALSQAIEERGMAHLALTGGSSAVNLYRELVRPAWRDAVDWSRVHLWWGDERFVPVDHPDSNVGLAYKMLLNVPADADAAGESGGPGIRAENVHPYEIDEALSESDPAELAAERMCEAIDELLPRAGGEPAFDVILLGVGTDGHILSVFPGSRALREDAPTVLVVPAPQHIEPHHPRLTFNPRLLEAARLVIVMATGEGKAGVLADVLDGDREPQRLPAQLAALPNAVWLLDRAAAAQLDGRVQLDGRPPAREPTR